MYPILGGLSMINKSLFDALQPGTNFPASYGLKPRRAKTESPSVVDGAQQQDRFNLTPANSQVGSQRFALQFRHLSIRREVAAVRASSQENVSGAQGDSQPASAAYQRVQEQRQTELNLFYARTQKISVGTDQGTSDHLQNTSQGVGRTFEVSISLDASFLHQFTGQSETLAKGDQELFDKYLSTTDQMTGLSGDAAQGFFDMVDQALQKTRSAVMGGLDGFLSQVGTSLGLEGDALNNFKSQVADQVAGFFTDLDKFVQQSRTLLAPSPQPQAIASAPPTTTEKSGAAVVKTA